MTYPHRWTTLEIEKSVATQYSMRDVRGKGVKYDYAQHLMYKFYRGRKSIEIARVSKPLRPQPLYLGGVLVLMRTVYHAMGAIDRPPPKQGTPQGVIPSQKPKRVWPMDNKRPMQSQMKGLLEKPLELKRSK